MFRAMADHTEGPMLKMLEETRQQPQALANTLEHGRATLTEMRRRFEKSRPGWWCWRRGARRTMPRSSGAT